MALGAPKERINASYHKVKTDELHMEETIKKFKFKGQAIVINAPLPLEKQFVELGFKTLFDKGLQSQNTLIFINNKEEFLNYLKVQLHNIKPDSVLWFAYPKLTSKIKTDIHRDIIRSTAEDYGITTIAAISIDDTWSALRFRPLEKVGK